MKPWDKAGNVAQKAEGQEASVIQRLLAPIFLRLRDLQDALEPFAGAQSVEEVRQEHLHRAALIWPSEGDSVPAWLKVDTPRLSPAVRWVEAPTKGGLYLWYGGPNLASVIWADPGGQFFQWPTGEHERLEALKTRIPTPHLFCEFPTP